MFSYCKIYIESHQDDLLDIVLDPVLVKEKSSVRIAGGVEPPYLILPTPYLWSKFDPGGSSFNPPPMFCWSWYAAWFTLPSNAILKISTVWWFECYYYFNSYWRIGLSSPGLSVKFLLRTWICNNVKKQNLLLPLLKYWTVKVIVVIYVCKGACNSTYINTEIYIHSCIYAWIHTYKQSTSHYPIDHRQWENDINR